MAYDEELAGRVREVLGGADEKRMFGGLAFLVQGYMTVAVSGAGGLMLRVDPGQLAQLRTEPHTEPVVMRGREMRGWVWVQPAGVGTDEQLRTWIDRATALVQTLPPKD